jgi:hypothetical protein
MRRRGSSLRSHPIYFAILEQRSTATAAKWASFRGSEMSNRRILETQNCPSVQRCIVPGMRLETKTQPKSKMPACAIQFW